MLEKKAFTWRRGAVLKTKNKKSNASVNVGVVGVSLSPSTGGGLVGLERLMTAMRGEDGFKTLAEYIASPHFRGAIARSQTPEEGKDWMHPADYLLPVSVHSIPVSDCDDMLRDLAHDHMREPGAKFTFAEALTYPENLWTTSLFFMFVGPDRSRAYNPHRHGVPNHTLMLQVKGYKHAVVWPNDESPNLYQITDLLPKSNEIAEMPGKGGRVGAPRGFARARAVAPSSSPPPLSPSSLAVFRSRRR